MIENIYSNTAEKEEEYPVSGRKPPKNVRQAGYFTGDLRIYIEDYVHTFTHWLAEQDYSKRCLAVLVGEFAKSEHTRDVYAYGTVVIEDACTDSGIEMTSEIWTQIYETIKNYFAEGEIVGWFYGGTSFTEEEKEMLPQVHLDYFAGTDRILMLYDFLDREEEFYRYEGEGLVRQSGYYIYYEKNTEMQNYMIDKKQGKNTQEEIEDRAVKEVRARLNANFSAQTKKEAGGRAEVRSGKAEQQGGKAGRQSGKAERQGGKAEWQGGKAERQESKAERQEGKTEQQSGKTEQQSGRTEPTESGGSKLFYTAGIVVAAVAVITGASMIYNQERMKGFEQTLNQIIGAVRQTGEKTPGQKDSAENNDTKNGNTETAGGNPGSIFEDPKTQETFQNGSKSEGVPSESLNSGGSPEKGENKEETSGADAEAEGGDQEETGETNNPAGAQGQDAVGNQVGMQNSNGAGTSTAEEKGEETENKETSEDGEDGSATGEGDGAAETSQGTGGLLDTSTYTVYTVQPGDTLVGICMRIYGSVENLDDIKALNQINNENLIYAYQELLLP